MKYLYLDPTFKPFGTDDEIKCTFSTWKGGEEHCRIEEPLQSFIDHLDPDGEGGFFPVYKPVKIVSRANNSSEVFRILLAQDALFRMGIEEIHLFTPYLPYARQDQVMVKGESLSSKVYARQINSCNFKTVSMIDPHSGVGPALLDRPKILGQGYLDFVKIAFSQISDSNPCVVSPDAGAYKKIYKTCEGINFKGDIVLCNKVRNLATTEIINLTVVGDVKDRTCVIIDDICDGGRTFAELGKQLKEMGAKAVYLIVTHGLFSYGEEQLKPHVDHVWSTDSFRSFESEFVTFIPLNNKTIKLS